MAALKAEEGQKLRNDLRLRIAELTQAITDEKAAIVAAAEARSKAERRRRGGARRVRRRATLWRRRRKTLSDATKRSASGRTKLPPPAMNAAADTLALETARDTVASLEQRLEEIRAAAELSARDAEAELGRCGRRRRRISG